MKFFHEILLSFGCDLRFNHILYKKTYQVIHSSFIIFYHNTFITYIKIVNNFSLTKDLKTKIPTITQNVISTSLQDNI